MACSCIYTCIFRRRSIAPSNKIDDDGKNDTGHNNADNNNNNNHDNNETSRKDQVPDTQPAPITNQNNNTSENPDATTTATNTPTLASNNHNRRLSTRFKSFRTKRSESVYEKQVAEDDKPPVYPWGYRPEENGPETWSQFYTDGLGQRQSPINIDTEATYVQYDSTLSPLKFEYDKCRTHSLFNAGHGFQVRFDYRGIATLSGGPLQDAKYQLLQLHAHWGVSNSVRGSEHTINGRSYPCELHFVHFNKDKYVTVDEAMQHPDGLAVIAIFLSVTSNPKKQNEELQNLVEDFSLIDNKRRHIPLDFSLQPGSFLPNNVTRYFTYHGSLTTPPLCESVTWIIFAEPLEIYDEQLLPFRDLRNPANGNLIEKNYRPLQAVNDRIVKASFPDYRKISEPPIPG